MEWIGFIILCLLDICMAQHWVMQPSCKEGPDRTGWENEIRTAMENATMWALNAHYVLDQFQNDPDVRRVVEHILGNDQGNVDRAKAILYMVSRYERYEGRREDVRTENDVVIACDGSDFEKAAELYYCKILETVVEDEVQDQIASCYRPDVFDGPAALTLPAFGVNYAAYYPLLQTWWSTGARGLPPDRSPFMVPLSKPNVINLCSNLLYDIDQPADDSDNEDGKPTYVTMTDGALEEVQSQEFLTRLDPSERPIDSLAFSLAGTLLHELSHTDLGGRTVDVGSPSDCYGWVCVGRLHNVNNADSIAQLAVALQLWMMGYIVDAQGFIHPKPR